MDITRIPGEARGRSRAVICGPFVWAVAVAGDKSGDVAAQTAQALAVIDDSLLRCGAGRDRIVSATVYLADMATKAEMDRVWCAWVTDGEGPQRACVGVVLAPGDLVEIVVLAARRA